MFSVLRRRLTYANVAVTVALVFAMSGGAYAASKYLIISTKQIKPSVLKQLQGKAGAKGAQGPVGPAGTAGPQGPAGAAGAKGETGAAGAGGKEGPQGKEGKQGPEGKEGSPWTLGGTLPKGKTETGVWNVERYGIIGEGEARAVISFPIPLNLKEGESGKAVYLNQAETQSKVAKEGCEGTAENPTAPAGTLCIYTESEENKDVTSAGIVVTNGQQGFGRQGAFMDFFSSGGTGESPGQVEDRGAWAVTAP